MIELEIRRQVTRRTMARFGDRAFGWGANDCYAMAHFHLVNAGLTMAPLPPYKTATGALKALKRRKCDSLEALLDRQRGLTRIAPAQMWLGDIATMAGLDGLSGIVIGAVEHVFGWHADDLERGAVMLVPFEFIAAWRVEFAERHSTPVPAPRPEPSE